MSREALFSVPLPAQDAQEFTLFAPREDAARAWAAQLPITNIREASRLLLEAVTALNHFPLHAEKRFQVLDTLSDYLRVTLANLNRRFLNQPLVMPDAPQQLADRCDALLAQLQAGYALVAAQMVEDPDSGREMNPARLVCESLYRAIHFAGRRVLLAFQLHRPVPPQCWLALHEFYALAEYQGLLALPVSRSENNAPTVATAYLQALMLGCCKPNQLRQSDLSAAYQALGSWGDLLQIGLPEALPGNFVVDLELDRPAVYRSLHDDNGSGELRSIETGALLQRLVELREEDAGNGRRGLRLDSGDTLSFNMLGHLADALGSASQRSFHRVVSNGPVLVALGLIGAHYHAAGERSYSRLVYGGDPRSALPANRPGFPERPHRDDLWSSANPDRDFIREPGPRNGRAGPNYHIELDSYTRNAIDAVEQIEAERPVPVYRALQVNSSPGGYCLAWDEKLPEEVRTGDIVCIQENPGSPWYIGVLRWASRVHPTHTLTGVELLSPEATACGAQVRQKLGELRSPQRALLLPEIKLVGQPATLVTPRTGFSEGLKVTLLRHGRSRHVRLLRQVSATASYARFEFSDVRELGQVVAEDRGGPRDFTFDSVWSNI